ncbi:MAG: DUF2029 domain-containing protein [Candidatus Levybacteria bacterium]|nr:DUF2029 domain-containing protein [Candidatus Levybacteria bacterium]
MNKLSLDSVLLFALVIPFIMGYRIGPGETPFLLFGFIFLLLLGNVLLDLFYERNKIYALLKNTILWVTIFTVIGSSFVSAIIVRHQTAPVYMIHDIILQQEAAMRFLLDGKNPYQETYFGTPLQDWHYGDTEVNPALYHFVMEPFYLLFAIPFYLLSNIFFGFFDARVPLLFLFFLLLVISWRVVDDQDKRRLFVILLAFHPSLLPYTLEGRSDIFMFTFLFAGWLFLLWKRNFLAGVSIGLAAAVKQSAWPFIPFYILYLFFRKKSLRNTAVALLPFVATFSLVTLPFLLWNPKAFLDSTVFYLSGNTENSYPISGYGFGSILLQLGTIKDKFVSYPFLLWQVLICIPLFVVLIKYLKKHTNVKTLIIVYAVFLLVYWYFSRYFNNSHIAFISYMLIAAYFWPSSEAKNDTQSSL